MKILYFFLLSVTCPALMRGTVYAAPTDEPKHQQAKNESARPADHNRAVHDNHPHAVLALPKASRAPLPSKNSNRTKAGTARSSRQHLVSPARNVRGGSPADSQTPGRTSTAPASTISRLPIAPTISTPHHGPNPARVGGAAIANARNSGTLNGKSVRGKR